MTWSEEPVTGPAKLGFATRAIHAGQEPDPTSGATVTPVYLSSIYAYDSVEDYAQLTKGYDYSRYGNPTRTAFETCLASLEDGEHCIAFSSGMAAIDAIFRLLRPGDHVLLTEDIYGGAWKLVKDFIEPIGVIATFVDMNDLDAVKRAIRSETRLMWLESPTNPLLRLLDLRALSTLAREHGVISAVDNTFATPYFQLPLALGADIVMHSTTKYISGHSDIMGGALVANDSAIYERLRQVSRVIGATPGAMDCFLALRGLKTLAVRMKAHSAGATAVAGYLFNHPKVARVNYPGLPNHPQRLLAESQMTGPGGMLSFELNGGGRAARAALNELKLFRLGGSLGGVESIASYPWLMSHVALPPEERWRLGVSESLIRLSVGIEEPEDLIADLNQALGKLG